MVMSTSKLLSIGLTQTIGQDMNKLRYCSVDSCFVEYFDFIKIHAKNMTFLYRHI